MQFTNVFKAVKLHWKWLLVFKTHDVKKATFESCGLNKAYFRRKLLRDCLKPSFGSLQSVSNPRQRAWHHGHITCLIDPHVPYPSLFLSHFFLTSLTAFHSQTHTHTAAFHYCSVVVNHRGPLSFWDSSSRRAIPSTRRIKASPWESLFTALLDTGVALSTQPVLPCAHGTSKPFHGTPTIGLVRASLSLEPGRPAVTTGCRKERFGKVCKRNRGRDGITWRGQGVLRRLIH